MSIFFPPADKSSSVVTAQLVHNDTTHDAYIYLFSPFSFLAWLSFVLYRFFNFFLLFLSDKRSTVEPFKKKSQLYVLGGWKPSSPGRDSETKQTRELEIAGVA